MKKRYLIPYTSANSMVQAINYLSLYYPIKIKDWSNMTPAQQLITLRNANTLGLNKGGEPGIYLETGNIDILTRPENYGKNVIFLNQTSINRRWLNSRDLSGAKYGGARYTMKEIEDKLGRRVYIKNLPNKDEKTWIYYIKRLFGMTRKVTDKTFRYVYSVNQIKKHIGEFQVVDPWNNIPPIQLSSC